MREIIQLNLGECAPDVLAPGHFRPDGWQRVVENCRRVKDAIIARATAKAAADSAWIALQSWAASADGVCDDFAAAEVQTALEAYEAELQRVSSANQAAIDARRENLYAEHMRPAPVAELPDDDKVGAFQEAVAPLLQTLGSVAELWRAVVVAERNLTEKDEALRNLQATVRDSISAGVASLGVDDAAIKALQAFDTENRAAWSEYLAAEEAVAADVRQKLADDEKDETTGSED